MALKAGLRFAGISTVKHNIWDNPADAAKVRSVANGNETVPTVFIGGHAMVNPTARQVKKAARELAPHLL
ncbi:MAG: glutaredoxin domain-containing protein [Actinomycetota bacterium]